MALVGAAATLGTSADAQQTMTDPPLPAKVTPDVTGLQRVMVIGCRFADTTDYDFLRASNSGIETLLANLHNYFDIVSNYRINLQAEFGGWNELPKSSDNYGADGEEATRDCQNIARRFLAGRNDSAINYRTVVMLFNRDLGFASQTGSYNDHVGTYTRLRFSGGTGGGWTSEALWAHELGHAFGLLHSTFPTRADGNQYNDFQDVMSGFSHSAQERWDFLAGGVCNGMRFHPECIYNGQADQMPVHYAAFQKQRLGWLAPDQIATHWGGEKAYHLSAPTTSPNGDSPLRRLKMVYVKIPDSTAYYAIEYRHGFAKGDDTAAAERRGWDAIYEKGIRSDRVTVYYVEPDLYPANKNDLGDANLMAVLNLGDAFDIPSGPTKIHVAFQQIDDDSRVTATVDVRTDELPEPRTLLFASGADGGWINQDASATLSASTTGAPIAATYYAVDDPGCNESTRACAVYIDGLTITGEGEHDLAYFSTDVSGQAEKAQHATVRIDKTPPATTASVGTAGGPVTLTLAASDAHSGVRQTDYQIDGGVRQPYQAPVTIAAPGAHTVVIQSADNAGNLETPQTLSVNVTVPPLTASAAASPASIARANGRAVSVHVAVRADTPSSTLRLDSVKHTGGGRERGWQVDTADVDGVVFAVPGATYTLDYTVTEPQGGTAHVEAKVVVAAH